MKYVIYSLMLMSLMACQSFNGKTKVESSACQQYRTMMTAPIAPSALAQLKAACEQTQQ